MWDASTGKEIAVLTPWKEGLVPVAFSRDGMRVPRVPGNSCTCCDAVTGHRLTVLGPHPARVRRLVYSSDSKRSLGRRATVSNTIHLWDGEIGKEVAVLRGHTSRVQHGGIQPDRIALVSGE